MTEPSDHSPIVRPVDREGLMLTRITAEYEWCDPFPASYSFDL